MGHTKYEYNIDLNKSYSVSVCVVLFKIFIHIL